MKNNLSIMKSVVAKLLLLLVLACNLSIAQEQKVVLPSPETAALFRYQDYPMDYSTGLPQISIPLFEVQNGSLRVPISISYHASGFKVTDVDGPIAAGWSLNVGGMVSRTIHGDPDFGDKPFPVPFDPYLGTPGQDVLEILERVTHYPHNPDLVTSGEFADSEYDMFSYSFGNHSGKFIFKDDDGVKTPIVLNQEPLKIYPTLDSNGLNSLNIRDDKGDNYTFVGFESQTTDVHNYTGFSVKKIVSANLKDTISYSYVGGGQQYRRYISQGHILKDVWDAGDPSMDHIGVDFENPTAQYYNISRISEIDFEQGTLQFVLKGGSGQDKNVIDNIQLKDRNGNLIRKIKFYREPLHSIQAVLGTTNLQTHKLSGIEIQDKNENTIENYAFDHYPTVYASQDASDEIIDSRFVDYWGYYNASGDTNMIPKSLITDYQQTTGSPPSQQRSVGNPNTNNRNPKLAALKSGVIKKIYYPTGGSTEFIYEMNKYKDSETNSPKNGPGLRVQQIVNSDGNGSTVKRDFKYSTSSSSFTDYGEIDLETKDEFMFTEHRYEDYGQNVGRHRERIFHSGFVPSLSELGSRPIRYTYVTEYKGGISDNIGKTVYNYDNFRWFYTKMPLPNGEGYKYNKWHIQQYRYWDTPMLINQTDYKAIKDGATITYDEIRKISNTYNPIQTNNIQALHVQRNYKFPDSEFRVGTPGKYFEEYCFRVLQPPFPVYAYGHYDISVGTKNLQSTIEKLTNDDGSTISRTTSYVYNSNNLVSEIKSTTSRLDANSSTQNILTKKEIAYPFDYNSTVYNGMTNLNMLNYKVEERNYLDDAFIWATKINYKDWNDNATETDFKPELIEAAKSTDSSGPITDYRTRYYKYDSDGNPTEISKENGPHAFYIWGYNGKYPIAKIENFTNGQAITIQSLIDAAVTASNEDNSDTGENNLRNALADIRNSSLLNNSMITTYTYDPLIGATSMTDSRGYTIYYEYDDFNRLKAIKDANGNRVSDYDYSYKQAVTN